MNSTKIIERLCTTCNSQLISRNHSLSNEITIYCKHNCTHISFHIHEDFITLTSAEIRLLQFKTFPALVYGDLFPYSNDKILRFESYYNNFIDISEINDIFNNHIELMDALTSYSKLFIFS